MVDIVKPIRKQRTCGEWQDAKALVQIYWFETFEDRDAIGRLRSILVKEELDRVNRFRFEVHKRRFIIGRGVLRAILARRLGAQAAAVVYILAWRQGIQAFRLIMIGIAVSAMLTAFNMWLMIAGRLDTVMSAAVWGAGSLNGTTWSKAMPSAIVCAIGMLLCFGLVRRARLMEMGDDMAGALGLSVGRTRLALMATGVILVAVATATTGPVVFIALADRPTIVL